MLPKAHELKKTSFGFTLIELLIVITIIAILASIAVASLITAQKKARDTQRKNDLKSVQSALQLYYSENNAYPDQGAGNTIECPSGSAIAWGTGVFTCNSKTYLKQLPDDPLGVNHYYYQTSSCSGSGTCQRYTLWASFEITNDPDANYAGAPKSPDALCTPRPGSYSFCVHPNQ